MMRVSRFVPTLMLLTLAGCGGGQTGDLSGESDKHGGNVGNSNGCEEQLTPLSLADSSALGFAAESVLEFAGKSWHSQLAWQALEGVQYSPSAGETALTLTLRGAGSAWLVHSVPAPQTGQGGPAIELLCPPDRLRMGVDAELTSADGALAESFAASLEAQSPYVASLSLKLVAEQVAGSFEITEVKPPDALPMSTASVQDLVFDAVLTPGGMAGALRGRLSAQNAQVASSSMLTFARFPSDSRCAPDQGGSAWGVPVAVDAGALGQTGTEALNQINGWSQLPFAWRDGAHSELRLELRELSDGCVRVASYFDPSQPAVTVVYPVSLSASTSDGRLQGQYSGSLVTWPDADGSGFSERIQVNAVFPADAPAATGFSEVSVPGGTQRLAVKLDALFQGAEASGKVSLDAQQDPPCVTNPVPPSANSSPGCAGTSVSVLLDGTWPR
jgi:hypothetical protein